MPLTTSLSVSSAPGRDLLVADLRAHLRRARDDRRLRLLPAPGFGRTDELARRELLDVGVVAGLGELERLGAVLAVALRVDGARPDRRARAVDLARARERAVEHRLDRRPLAAEPLDDHKVRDLGSRRRLLAAHLRPNRGLRDHLHALEWLGARRLRAGVARVAGDDVAVDVPTGLPQGHGARDVVAGAVRLPLALPRRLAVAPDRAGRAKRPVETRRDDGVVAVARSGERDAVAARLAGDELGGVGDRRRTHLRLEGGRAVRARDDLRALEPRAAGR